MSADLRLFFPSRFPTREVRVGTVGIGGSNPIRIQSMTTASTNDTTAVVREAIALFEAGAELVRMTAQGPREAHNLEHIRRELNERGFTGPLVADIHFSPHSALIAVEHVEKVRINPGNFIDTKRFATIDYSDAEYADELGRLEEAFLPLLQRAGELHRALRIGVNHGSLSDRIMNRFGDTPAGMVESALEFLRIGARHGFHDMVVSMKASNPVVMIRAYRHLVERFRNEGMNYPLHLGVTEAGEGRDGRIKSAIGIGALLLDGIGDTIRVSLTEDAVHEMPAARSIIQACTVRGSSLTGPAPVVPRAAPQRRVAVAVPMFADAAAAGPEDLARRGADFLLVPEEDVERARREFPRGFSPGPAVPLALVTAVRAGESDEAFLRRLLALQDCGILLHWQDLTARTDTAPDAPIAESVVQTLAARRHLTVVRFERGMPPDAIARAARSLRPVQGLVLTVEGLPAAPADSADAGDPHAVFFWRRLASALNDLAPSWPRLMLSFTPRDTDDSLFRIPAEAGSLLLDGIGDILAIGHTPLADTPLADTPERPAGILSIDAGDALSAALDILQATRLRITRTEFISCPGCGRTLFPLQETTARIKRATGHLTGVKIAIMGCIVNGPGEMADADFGYVGAGPGRINLYRGKDVVRRNVPAEIADRELISLIQEAGLWTDAAGEA